MAVIKYVDKNGEHKGTLSPAEYYIHAFNAELKASDKVPYFEWDNTDYVPFLRAVSKKYNTTADKAWIV